MNHRSAITVTDLDLARLSEVASRYLELGVQAAEALRAGLERANVVAPSTIGRNVVTMNSRVLCRDDSGATRELEIVYPWHANLDAGKISVLARLGCALLGASVGDLVVLSAAGGKSRTWSVEAIHYQPESAGRFDL